MEDSSESSRRRQEIMQYLQQEREKRKEKFELEDFEPEIEVAHSFRSETIARLVQERRNQDLYQLSKANLQDALKDDLQSKQNFNPSESSDFSPPQSWQFEEDQVLSFDEKPKKREIPTKTSRVSHTKEKTTQKPANLPKQLQKPEEKSQVRLKNKKSEESLSNATKNHSQKPSKALSSVSSDKDLKRDPFEKRIEELMKIKEEGLKQREQEKKKKDEAELKECSFAPQVTPYFAKNPSIDKIEDRLMKLGQEQQKNREKVNFKQLIKEKELQETSCKFIPKISENSANMIKNYQPIHERLEELQKERQDIISKLRNNVEAKAESNFRPKINPQSSKLASNRSVSIENSQSRETHTSKRRVQEDIIQSEVQNFTFTPQTASKPGSLKSFFDRQEEFIKKCEKNKLQKKQVIEDTCTFKPSINSNSRCMTLEEDGDKFERMSKQEMEKRVQKQAKIQEDYYSKFSYEPKINPTSKLICKNSSTGESKAVPIVEDCESFSFRPKIETKKFKNVKSHYADPGNILEKIKEKEREKQEKLRDLKIEAQEKEAKNCTFQPRIVEKTESKDTVLVPGFDKFMAWKELSKKQEEEKKQREFKAFGLKGNTNSITVPQPFNLAPDKKEEKIEKIKQQIDDQFSRDCTFKPKTLES